VYLRALQSSSSRITAGIISTRLSEILWPRFTTKADQDTFMALTNLIKRAFMRHTRNIKICICDLLFRVFRRIT